MNFLMGEQSGVNAVADLTKLNIELSTLLILVAVFISFFWTRDEWLFWKKREKDPEEGEEGNVRVFDQDGYLAQCLIILLVQNYSQTKGGTGLHQLTAYIFLPTLFYVLKLLFSPELDDD